MPSKRPRHLRIPLGLLIRVGLAVSAVVINLVLTGHAAVLPWAFLLVLVDTASSYLLDGPVAILRSTRVAEWAAVSMAGLAGAGAVTAGPGALLLLLIPASMAGQRLRPLGASLLTAVQLILALLVAARSDILKSDSAVTFHQSLALITIIAFLVAWGLASRTSRTSRGQVRAAEAAGMLEQLMSLARGFDHGFDGPAHAADALGDFLTALSADRGLAVVADLDRQPQTWAAAGVGRQLCPPVDTPDSPLAPAWDGQVVAVPRWRDAEGRERALLGVPLLARDGSPIGVLVADRLADRPFSDGDVRLGQDVAQRHETFIELACLFAWLRDQALYEERDRLSREMHDGIGQEIAALGYQLDAARRVASQSDPTLANLLTDVRASLSEVASDVRLHISDLRRRGPSVPRAHVAISTRLAAFRSATGIATSSTLEPTPENIGTGAELALYRVVVAVLRDAAESSPTRVSVQLRSTRDTVTLVASHNGSSHITAEKLAQLTAMTPEADVTVPECSEHGVVVRVVLLLAQSAPISGLDDSAYDEGVTVSGAGARLPGLTAGQGEGTLA